MFFWLRPKKETQKVSLSAHQLPRLRNMRVEYERKSAEPELRENIITRARSTPGFFTDDRKARNKAFFHWFLRGEGDYAPQFKQNMAIEYIERYANSPEGQYLKYAEMHWNDTLAIEKTKDIESAFWIERPPSSIRLIEEKKSA